MPIPPFGSPPSKSSTFPMIARSVAQNQILQPGYGFVQADFQEIQLGFIVEIGIAAILEVDL